MFRAHIRRICVYYTAFLQFDLILHKGWLYFVDESLTTIFFDVAGEEATKGMSEKSCEGLMIIFMQKISTFSIFIFNVLKTFSLFISFSD